MGKSPSAYVLIQHPERWQKGVPTAIHWDMPKIIKMTGNRYGRFVVVDEAPWRQLPDGKLQRMVQARCDCGTWKVVLAYTLRTGASKSCGCLNSERSSARRTTHGLSYKTPEFRIWLAMRERCRRPKNNRFEHYGARGITVCERWLNSFENFLADMGHRPTEKHTIDRENNDLGYTPENCRWATAKTQSRNKGNNHRITHCGKTMILADWAKEVGISRELIATRLKAGWSIHRALTDPPRGYR